MSLANAGGACDTRRCHTAIIERQGTPILPNRRNGRPWKEDGPAARARNGTLRATRHHGRAFRKRWTGSRARSRIEAKRRGLKALGERISARDPDRRIAGIHTRIALMNRPEALGTAETVRVARSPQGKRKERLKPELRNNAEPRGSGRGGAGEPARPRGRRTRERSAGGMAPWS